MSCWMFGVLASITMSLYFTISDQDRWFGGEYSGSVSFTTENQAHQKKKKKKDMEIIIIMPNAMSIVKP